MNEIIDQVEPASAGALSTIAPSAGELTAAGLPALPRYNASVTHAPANPTLDLIDRLRSALAAREEVLEGYLFGSSARGEAQAHSDVDVAVFVDAAVLSRPGFGYEAELGTVLQQALARPDVDVVVLNRAGPVLYHSVLRDGERLFARDLMATTTREGTALSRYCDYVPVLRKIEALHRARIAAGSFGR